MGRTPGKACSLLAVDVTQLRHKSEQHWSNHLADTRNPKQDRLSLLHALIVLNDRLDLFVEGGDAPFDLGNMACNLFGYRFVARGFETVSS